MTASRPDAPVVAAQHETRDPARVATYDADRTAETAEPRSTLRTDSSMKGGEAQIVRTSTATTDTGAVGAARQQERVTLVTSKAPPLTLMETPAYEPRDGEFWVAGIWRGESGEYVWQAGRIEPDRTGRLYVPANWASSSKGWEYTPEYWR